MPRFRHPHVLAAVVIGVGALAGAPEVAHAQRRCRVTEVQVAPPDAQMSVGSTYPFLATAYDAAGNPCESFTVTWSSSNPAVATIDNTGIARGISPGAATITARVGAGAATRTGQASLSVQPATGVEVESTPPPGPGGIRPVANRPGGPGYAAFDRQPEGTGPADGLFVAPLQLTLVRGESRYLEYRAVRSDGQNAARVPIIFTVDPGGERVVLVDSLGLITSLGDSGTVQVRLVVPGNARIQPKLVRVEVRADSLRFNPREISLTPGAVETLSVFVPAQQRALNPSGLFQFSSSDESKVRVNPVRPVVEAVAPGTARIVAQSAMYPELSVLVHVHRPVTRLALTPAADTVTIAIGGTDTLRASALAEDSTAVPEAPLTWRNADSAVVAFDAATGVVRGRRSGMAQISVSVPVERDSALTRTIRVRVVAGSIAVSRPRVGIPYDERLPIEVSLLDERRQRVGSALSFLTWTSTADTVARVEGNHIVAQRPGRTRLTGRATWDSTVTVDVFVVGDVIVSGQNEGRRDLIMKWHGTQRWTPLTADSLVELQAAWSPDFTRVLFTAQAPVPQRVATSTLYLMNLDGSDRVRLTDDSGMVRFPAFARGGQSAVFEWNRGGRQQVWMLDIDSGTARTPRQITTTPAANFAPAVSPDSRRLAYVSARDLSPGRSTYGLYQANLDGSDERMLVGVPSGQRLDHPLYSPDGRSLLFLRLERGRPATQRVFRIGLSGQPGDTAVAVTPPTLFVLAFSASSDGSLLALNTVEEVQRGQPVLHVLLYSVATGETQPLEVSPEERLASPVLRPQTPAAPATR